MPELPEVHTTVEGIKKVAVGKTILDVWSDYYVSTNHNNRSTIKNKNYFDKFKKLVKGRKIISAERRGKNILINLNPSTSSGQVAHTVVIHMKMTGHVMYGKYKKEVRGKSYEIWKATEKGPLQDSYNQFIHLVLSLSDGKQLVLSDMRKFASVTISETDKLHLHDTLGTLGPEPLSKSMTPEIFFQKLQRKKTWPIKSALLDQESIAGIGNIYSDEILWETSIHPLSETGKIPKKKFYEMYEAMKNVFKFSIKHGGDSKSDYRNIFGEKGGFQNFHKVYSRRKEKCVHEKCKNKKGAIIERIVVKGRSSHFCPIHQEKY